MEVVIGMALDLKKGFSGKEKDLLKKKGNAMMISSFRTNLRSHESGQAIILGAVSLLVMAVTIMVTIQLGWTIKERVSIQHAADNAAYTTAAVVARSLNFMSFMNRAMVAHYVSAMSIQSILGILEAFVMIVAFTASFLLNIGAVLGAIGLIPIVAFLNSPIARGLGAAGEALLTFADKAGEVIKIIDPFIAAGAFIMGSFANIVTYGVQMVLGKLLTIGAFANTAATALPGMTNFYSTAIQDTAGLTANSGEDLGIGDAYTALVGIHGAFSYLSLFSKYSEKIKIKKSDSDSLGVYRSEILMAEIVNASREGKNGVTWETNRELGAGELVDTISEKISSGGGSGFSQAVSNLGDGVEAFLNKILPHSEGESMLVKPMATQEQFMEEDPKGSTNSTDYWKSRNHVFQTDTFNNSDEGKKHNAYFSRGNAMVSADYVYPAFNILQELVGKLPFGEMIWGWLDDYLPGMESPRVVGVQATYDKNLRFHCKYEKYETVVGTLGGLLSKLVDEVESAGSECKPGVDDEGNEVPPSNPDCQAAQDAHDESGDPGETVDNVVDKIDDASFEVFRSLIGGVPGKVVSACEAHNHHVFWGITKYVSFNIEGFEEDMKYPSFLAAVNKVSKFPIEVGLGFDEGEPLKMQSIGDVQGKKCDDENEFKGCLTEYQFNHVNPDNIFRGMHAWARSQVYYHRPGTWTEPPNMFNPFWRPKLSPMAPYLGGDALSSLGESFNTGDSEFWTVVSQAFSVMLGKLPEMFLLH